MSIATLSAYQRALKEDIVFSKVIVINSGQAWSSGWNGSGVPAAGSYAIGNTANGVVPTDATVGAPAINYGSGDGFLTYAEMCTQLVYFARAMLCDRLFHAGSYAFNAAVTLASQPSFSSRVPGGTDFTGLRLWIETVTQFTGGTPAITVTYTDQSGNAGHTTGAFSFGAGNTAKAGQMYELPLAAGDSGIQKIESVAATTATAGTFNILVLRPLLSMTMSATNATTRYGPDRAGFYPVPSDACLFLMVSPQSATGLQQFDCLFRVASA